MELWKNSNYIKYKILYFFLNIQQNSGKFHYVYGILTKSKMFIIRKIQFSLRDGSQASK